MKLGEIILSQQAKRSRSQWPHCNHIYTRLAIEKSWNEWGLDMEDVGQIHQLRYKHKTGNLRGNTFTLLRFTA